MIHIEGGTFRMGSDRHYVEEAPAHTVSVDAFWLDAHPVTNGQFAQFVGETGYVTTAELPPSPEAYPGADPDLLHPGSLVFHKPDRPVPLHDFRQWWSFVVGANWRHPEGRESDLRGRMDHPVVHVTHEDAAAYAAWAGKRLPTEAEWEFACRGGLEGAAYPWGEELTPAGRHLANTWQGSFPWQNLLADGWERTSPVGAFPPNGYGLVDMIGNVWEWTSDWFRPRHPTGGTKSCCVPKNPRGGSAEESIDPAMPDIPIPRKVLKGGSYLCAPNYCQRYRPAARFPQAVDTSTCHVGFRCAASPPPAE